MVTCVSLSAILGFVTWAILKYHHNHHHHHHHHHRHHHQDHFQESSSWSRWQLTRPEEANEEFAAWKLWVGNNCTWLYIGSQVIKFTILKTLKVLHQAAWAVFVVSLFFSKFGDVKLGLEGSTPEYNNASWWLSYGGIVLKLNNIVKSFSSLSYIIYSVLYSVKDLIRDLVLNAFCLLMLKNDLPRFSMLFACGVGTGLFFYGVAEPIYHYTSEC